MPFYITCSRCREEIQLPGNIEQTNLILTCKNCNSHMLFSAKTLRKKMKKINFVDTQKKDDSCNSNLETEAITHEKPSKFASFMQGVGNVINKIADAENEVKSWGSERLEREKNRPHSYLVDIAMRCRLESNNLDDKDE